MNSALVVAAGEGTRFGLPGGKQYADLLGKPLLAYSIEELERSSKVDGIVIVTNADRIEFCRDRVVKRFTFNKVLNIVAGGERRQDSVYLGLNSLPLETKKVIIHDGARPLIRVEKIDEVTAVCSKKAGAILAVPVTDTIKSLDQKNMIIKTIDRERLWRAQTPQVFFVDKIKEAHERAMNEGFVGTDDAVLMERIGFPVRVVMGDYDNIKITTVTDLATAEALLRERMKAG